jgi:hypothetical protein
MNTTGSVQKNSLDQELVTSMFRDQFAWIEDRTHTRKINEDNAVNSLRQAEHMAIKIYA